jgi:hypothetical protein
MLKIRGPEDQDLATFSFSGRIEEQNVPQLRQLLDGEPEIGDITFDLKEVRLVDREAVRFLADCEARGIKLKNCPPYIRLWIGKGSGTGYEP